MSEFKDLRCKDNPMSRAEIQARSNEKRQVRTVGTMLALINDEERELYERWRSLPNKKIAFMEAMQMYFDTLDKQQ